MGAVKLLRPDIETEPGTAADAPNTSRESHLVLPPADIAPFGRTIIINVLGSGPKVCSFDCSYCDLGRTFTRMNRLKTDMALPSVASITTAVTASFQEIHDRGPAIDSILISGNGEPTLHPEFPELIHGILEARNIWLPGKPIRIMTNGYALDNRKITDAMNLVEDRIVKLDAGNEKMFKATNAPLSRTNLARVLNGIRKLRDVTVQAMFFNGPLSNTAKTDFDDWMEVIAMIKPKAVLMQGLSRPSATPELIRLSEDQIYGLANLLERRTLIKATVVE